MDSKQIIELAKQAAFGDYMSNAFNDVRSVAENAFDKTMPHLSSVAGQARSRLAAGYGSVAPRVQELMNTPMGRGAGIIGGYAGTGAIGGLGLHGLARLARNMTGTAGSAKEENAKLRAAMLLGMAPAAGVGISGVARDYNNGTL